jgi:outer membrane lipoprotein-sorting protein
MRRSICVICMALLSLCIGAFGQVPPRLDADKSTVDDVLDALQASGKDLKAFSADVQMKIEDETFGSVTTQFGKVWFQTKPAGGAVMHVSLDHKKIGAKSFPEQIDYLLDEGWLTDRSNNKETRIQLARSGEKVNLFQLGKGPFPLPIGQDKQDVHAQFDVKITPAGKEDPAGTIHLQLTPNPGTPLADNFYKIEVWVDCTTRMPVRIATENKKRSEYKTTDLLNLKVKPVIKPEDITLPPLPPGWTTVDKPLAP